MADWATVALEIGLLFCLWNVSAFRGGLALLVFFHLGVLLTMDISFQHQIFVYALFVDWENTFKFIELSVGIPKFFRDWYFPLFIGVISVGYYYVGSPVSLVNQVVPIEIGVSPTTLILMLGAAIFSIWKMARKISSLQI